MKIHQEQALLQSGESRQFGATKPTESSPPPTPISSTNTSSTTPVDKHSILIKALHSFAPHTFEVTFWGQSNTRSIEIGSVEVWDRFVATLRSDSESDTATQSNLQTETQVLYKFIQDKLRYVI